MKFSIVNEQPFPCGCVATFSDGHGEYSDVIDIVLCKIHSPKTNPVDFKLQTLQEALKQTKNKPHRTNWWNKHKKEINSLPDSQKRELRKIWVEMNVKDSKDYESKLEKEMPGGIDNGEFPPLAEKKLAVEIEKEEREKLLITIAEWRDTITNADFDTKILVNFPGQKWYTGFSNYDLYLVIKLCKAERERQHGKK